MVKGSSANGLPRARSANTVIVIAVVDDNETEGRKAANYYLITLITLLLNTRKRPLVTVWVVRIDKISCFQIVQQNAYHCIY